MLRRASITILTAALVFSFVVVSSVPAIAGKAPRISQEVANALIGNPEVAVIDVRRQGDYDKSASMIKGAARESEKDISWSSKYPKDKILILYCA